MNTRSFLRLLLSPWLWLGAIAFAIVLLIITGTLLFWTRPRAYQLQPSTAILAIIEAPTATPPPVTPEPVSETTPTSEIPPSPPPGVIGIGAYVQVTGTGGDGVRMRQNPGLTTPVLFIGIESEVFQVKDGPQQVDDYTWWYLTALNEEARYGWVVANFLSVVQNP